MCSEKNVLFWKFSRSVLFHMPYAREQGTGKGHAVFHLAHLTIQINKKKLYFFHTCRPTKYKSDNKIN